MKLWAGRFNKVPQGHLENFLASIQFDQELATYDIYGSLAHAHMLQKVGLINTAELKKLKTGLKKILKNIENNSLTFSVNEEDIHLNIETFLFKEIGEVAGKLHTGRSRNDQVALDLHLYLRQQILEVSDLLLTLQNTVLTLAKQNQSVIMPGYTHLQHAQPILFSYHLLAYAYNFQRDLDRFQELWKRVNLSPLGSCALAGSNLPLDRKLVAKLLNFSGIYENSMDAISNRDLVVEFVSCCSLSMMHLSRLCEEVILWSSQEFNFISLDDAVCTGSSIMPQKKNPDIAELVRGKTGRVYGALMGILTVLKSLPMAYNKDLQEDKEGLFDTVKTIRGSLFAMTTLLQGTTVNADKMLQAADDEFSCATMLANYLVEKNIPFRKAHHIVGSIVQHCIKNNIALKALPLTDYKKFNKVFSEEIYDLLDLKKVIHAYKTEGSSSLASVLKQIKSVTMQVKTFAQWHKQQKTQLEQAYAKLF